MLVESPFSVHAARERSHLSTHQSGVVFDRAVALGESLVETVSRYLSQKWNKIAVNGMLGASMLFTPSIPHRISVADIPPSINPAHTLLIQDGERAAFQSVQSGDCGIHDPGYNVDMQENPEDNS